MKKKNISIYVRNSKITPSSYYRIAQYVKDIDGNVRIYDIAPTKWYIKNLKLNKKRKIMYLLNNIPFYFVLLIRLNYFIIMDLINNPDYVIVSKQLLPKYIPTMTLRLFDTLTKKSVLYWDFDDLIFHEGFNNQINLLGNNSKLIVTTSGFLLGKLNHKWQKKAILMPTTDGDLGIRNREHLLDINNIRKQSYNSEIRLIWVASNSSIPYLEYILETLDIAGKKLYEDYNKKIILSVVCNSPIKKQFKNLEIKNVEWTRETAIKEILHNHIGIMPLQVSEFALGKGGFKLIQYMAAGLPCIASAVGYNKEVIAENEGYILEDSENLSGWIDAIIDLSINWNKWHSYSENAFAKWNTQFSYKANLDTWRKMLKNSEVKDEKGVSYDVYL